MERYKYIIIDDEYPSHLPIQHQFIAYPNYQCVATFFNPEEALVFLQKNEIDLIFLDIEMPEMNGFQFLEALQKNIFVVILTAYDAQYSLEAHQHYDKNLVSYSNKAQFFYYLPKIIKRFETMYKEREVLDRLKQLAKNEIQTFPKMIKNKAIPLTDIVYITVYGHNTVLKMKNGEELIYRMSIKSVGSTLPPNLFFKIKRNTIINIMYVTSFTESTVCTENKHFIIATRNRKEVVRALKEQRELLYKNL